MLVLARRKGEKIVITVPPSTEPQEITITNEGIKSRHREQMVLGIQAEPSVRILREEIINKPPKERN